MFDGESFILRSISLEAECDFVSNKYGSLCKIKYKGKVLVLLLPNTFMNLSGKSVNYWLKAEKIKQNIDPEKVIYLSVDNVGKSIEGLIMDELLLNKMCCRRHMLTHVDIE